MSVTPLTARPADFPLDRGKVALLVIAGASGVLGG